MDELFLDWLGGITDATLSCNLGLSDKVVNSLCWDNVVGLMELDFEEFLTVVFSLISRL